MFENAQRPVLIFGWGIHLAGAEKEALAFAEHTGIPVCLTWGAADLMRHDNPLRIGTFGTHGNKYANLAIQNADLVLSIGSRLDTKATGFPASSFASKARLQMCDIDQTEIDKFKVLGRSVDGYRVDAKQFLTSLIDETKKVTFPDYSPWLEQIEGWKQKYPAVKPEWGREEMVNPYAVVEKLSDYVRPDDVIVSDTGCVLAWMMQAFKFSGQRFIHAFNQTPMGYGLPAAIGAAFSHGKRVVLVTGDGGLSVNITELATVARHSLPIKIVVFNNRGHAMCRQTQRQWLGGEYPSTSYEGGLATPDFSAIAKAYGLSTYSLTHRTQLDSWVHGFLHEHNGAALMEVMIDPSHGVEGQIKFGEPLAEAA